MHRAYFDEQLAGPTGGATAFDDTASARSIPDQKLRPGIASRALSLLLRTLGLLWYLIPRRGRPVRQKARHELHPLSYLDALRGYLALVIYTGHTMSRYWFWIPKPVMAVPWVQFYFRGSFASLDMFFWISGYAVTYRLVGFVQTRQYGKLLDALASSVFRRYMRLFLPILPVTLVTALAVSTGIAIPPKSKAEVISGNPLVWWVKDVGHIFNPFTQTRGYWDGQSGSDLLDQTWSLSTEFRSSMMLFSFCIATCKMTTRNRKLLLWLCVPPFFSWQAQWAVMALVGMWFAECRQERTIRQKSQTSLMPMTQDAESEKSTQAPPPTSLNGHLDPKLDGAYKPASPLLGGATHSQRRFRKPLLIALFFYSFIVLKDPYDTEKKTLFPHNLLNRIVPDHWHAQMRMHMHLCIGAVMMLYPLDRVEILQRPLLSPFSQYLGELSFGIYAVHFTVQWIVWDPRYVEWMYARYTTEAFNHFWIAFPGYFVMTILNLWAAELFRRVDMQVIKLCKYLEEYFFVS